MTRTLLAGIVVALAGSLVLASGCSLVFPSDPTLSEGNRLEVTDHVSDLPASRTGYARMVTFNTPAAVQIVDPGTGPDDLPRLLRTIRFPEHLVNEQQIDSDGFLWVTTPDGYGGPLRVTYVVDPHAGRVHRAIELPHELRAAAGLSVGARDVYLRAWRDGFSGGIGVVSRTCASDPDACGVRLLTELGNVGGTPDGQSLHLDDGNLYSFNTGNSRDQRESTARLDPTTGAEVASYPLSGASVSDDDHFYVIVLREPGRFALVRLDKLTLQEEDSVDVPGDPFQVAYDQGQVYVSDGARSTVKVYDAATLDAVTTIDISAAGAKEAAFGFLAPGVLLLNHHAWLNTQTRTVVPDGFPLQESFSKSVRFPQGHPLAH